MSAAPLLANEMSNGGSAGAALTLGVLSDAKTKASETRVSMVPDTIPHLIKMGYAVHVEAGAGRGAGLSDKAYAAAGATVLSRYDVIKLSKILFSITPPETDFVSMKDKWCVSWVGRMLPDGKNTVARARDAGVTLIDMTAVPRITIAQACDVLSSQAKVAGVRAVVEATHAFGRFHTAEMSAAGKYPPSQTFVLGCGVAGLAAMGCAKAYGSVVRAWDVRDVSDQVISLGASWVKVDFKEDGAGAGGYAKESSAAFAEAQKKCFHEQFKECDIVITTAAIPGRPSPRLIEDYMVADMKPGSVIVDLAALGGGNCSLTQKGQKICTENGVTIIGYDNLASMMPTQASAMYGMNCVNLLKHIGGKPGAHVLLGNWLTELGKPDGEIVARSIVCCMNGRDIPMPPPPAPTPLKKKEPPAPKVVKEADPHAQALWSALIMTVVIALLTGMGDGVPTSLLATFVLAGAAGYQVVWGVTHALHTPLMAVTNAISGSTAIGGMILLNKANNSVVTYLAAASVAVSFVNIVGGFIVTRRMLKLFQRAGDVDYSHYALLPGLALIGMQLANHDFIASVDVMSALMCIGAIGCLASMKSANTGCILGIGGIAAAVVAECLKMREGILPTTAILCAAGGAIGVLVGGNVEPMKLPQTVAGFHALVGLAAMLSSIGHFQNEPEPGVNMVNVFCMLGDFIGGITLTGSLIAFGKLDGRLSSKALDLPGKNYLNICGLLGFFSMMFMFCTTSDPDLAVSILWATAALACVMGVHLVGSVGGGDMPVCITVLNSYSGWALVAEGFMMQSVVLTIVGSLIGFSGAILTHIMCVAMNRDIFNVIFGGMNVVVPKKKDDDEAPKVHRETNGETVAELCREAKKILIVPGYGMAAGRAQNAVADMTRTLRGMDVVVEFGIHPVAGRMPGQMNVLLAEANVPYDWVKEMDEVNPDMEDYDVCLVIGANDITNSAANDVEGCSIYGMPVIEVWRAKKVIFCKRSMAGGYADLENPVFFKDNTDMLLGNATSSCEAITGALRQGSGP